MFGGNFAPAGWMFCDGQLLPISENETLFQLIGTTYGGDGESTFALPDMRGRLPMHQGNGFILAETGGAEEITLTVQQIPSHTHPMLASADPSQRTALFSLLGTAYGGNGKSNFALPDLQGRAPMHPGQGPGLSLHDLGESGGSETVTLLESEIPAHSHALRTFNDVGEDRIPSATEAI